MAEDKPSYRITDTHVYFHGKTCPLSNWYIGKPFKAPLPAVISDSSGRRLARSSEVLEFNCGEQAMMAWKALIFGDRVRLASIMKTPNPYQQKEFGKAVSPYRDPDWSALRKIGVTMITYSRMSADEEAREFLMAQKGKRFVEGSKYDTIWGVGIDLHDPRIDKEGNWRGTNILGDVHEDVQDLITEHGPNADAWTVVSELVRSRRVSSPSP